MSDELKVQLPDGYRWVMAGEIRGHNEWKTSHEGKWQTVTSPPCFTPIKFSHIYITPIEPPKPETVDVEITGSYGRLWFGNPNNVELLPIHEAPSIVGPEWAFVGFLAVWGDDGHKAQPYYYLTNGDRAIYAKAVRFRRVQGGAK